MFRLEYFGKVKVICENALGCETETWGEMFEGKARGQSRASVPLSYLLYCEINNLSSLL
jgi:hypothetical protein